MSVYFDVHAQERKQRAMMELLACDPDIVQGVVMAYAQAMGMYPDFAEYAADVIDYGIFDDEASYSAVAKEGRRRWNVLFPNEVSE